MELGGGAAEEIAQLLDHHGQDRRLAAVISSHYGGLGPVAGRLLFVQQRQQLAQSAKSGAESSMRGLHGRRA